MTDIRIGAVEEQFANIIWDNEPLLSRELVALCAEKLGWKKSTTYTVLKKLCDKGIFKNEDSVVTSLISREEYIAMQSEQFVEETFSGSLPAFIATFTHRKKLTEEEIAEIKALIDQMGE